MKRFQWLAANSNNVSLECNQHRAYYDTVEKSIQDSPQMFSDLTDVERAELIANNAICVLQLYPDTPGGFLFFIHWDPEVCVERAYRWLKKERGIAGDDAVPIEDAGPHPKDGE